MDYVERLREQWEEQMPDVDMSPADSIGRITRIAALLAESSDAALAQLSLTRPEFEVLTALRRAGDLRAREVTTITRAPGASITKRLDHLQREGLVERTVVERDRRGVLLSLTEEGPARRRALPRTARPRAGGPRRSDGRGA
ncbi:MarR family transcriptional regulator [Oerskovia sp. M15]